MEQMTKRDQMKQKALEDAKKLFENMTQEEANQYFADNLTKTQITKAHMSAYLRKFAKEEDKKWISKDFYEASFKSTKRKESSVCTDANGVAIYKLNKEHRAIVKTIRVDSNTGETYDRYNIFKAREAFIEHFKITPKNSKFKPKDKNVNKNKRFDEFDGLFPKKD